MELADKPRGECVEGGSKPSLKSYKLGEGSFGLVHVPWCEGGASQAILPAAFVNRSKLGRKDSSLKLS
ncbi:hypothetical protein BaRGS_00021850 [Batillaria attramentaria]|uniref:Uncharacterized protein n=1 Tax=Batillaria attramentaria TaxID=370345 RepID=A0ABD0KIL9_9CAEN